MILYPHSYSPYTILEIRYGNALELKNGSTLRFGKETERLRVTRLAAKYALPEVEIKLLIAADYDQLDGYGRMRA